MISRDDPSTRMSWSSRSYKSSSLLSRWPSRAVADEEEESQTYCMSVSCCVMTVKQNTHGYTQTVAWKPMVNAPWKMKSIAAAAIPAPAAEAVWYCTWYMSAACTAITAAMTLIMDSRSGLLPILSIKNHGMNDATKNQVCRNPLIREAMCVSKPMLFSNSVPE
jgi:hypothetical protein